MYKTIKEQELRPARKQVGEEVLRDLGALRGEMEAGSTYNIWYNKWTGHRNSFSEPAVHKLDPVKDVGKTKGSADKASSFCLFFARGCCPHGSNCRFWHRIPCPEDREEIPVDLFGRERHMNFRDDMGGAGAFGRENKVLYVGRVAPYPDMEEVILRYFSPFGEIAKVNALKSKGVVFIEYTKRIYAEFSKEVMANQKLDRKEILNVRWATEDPNPGSKEEFQQLSEQMVYQALTKDLPAEYSAPSETQDEEQENPSKKARVEASEPEHSQDTSIHENVANTLHQEKAQNSLISIDVLQTLGYMSQHINNTRAYLSQPSSAPPIPLEKKPVSLLGEDYDSE
ncbi:Pre-mRNA-splicing factor [Entomophthora muscae]|uniref:Pre-mRNA-splicing factor n=1 Tax=Entomophthora muscae TaxID=34485 RepID=A0ACC2T9U8_9FUNG|nr:Pre-mRNA-splicing factor [Entomophthora muscae]